MAKYGFTIEGKNYAALAPEEDDTREEFVEFARFAGTSASALQFAKAQVLSPEWDGDRTPSDNFYFAIRNGSPLEDGPADNRIDFDALNLVLGDRTFALEWLARGGQVDVPPFVRGNTQYHSVIVDKMAKGESIENYSAYDVIVEESTDTNVISSWVDDKHSKPLIDIDFEARLVPSSTPGRYHLYLDKKMKTEEYAEFVEALHRFGIIADGNLNQMKRENKTFLRLPWVKKGFLADGGASQGSPTFNPLDPWALPPAASPAQPAPF